MIEEILVKKNTYKVEEELNSFSLLVSKDDKKYVVYNFTGQYIAFDNFKFAAKRLKNCGIITPKVLEIDKKNYRVLAEYIEGPTAFEMIAENELEDSILEQVFNNNFRARYNHLRLDFNPEKFRIRDGKLIYMPFTFTKYIREEDFTEKEIRLWFYTKEFVEELRKIGLPQNDKRLMNEFQRNKQIVLTVVKYFK